MADSIVELRSVSKQFGSVHANQNVNLAVRRNSIHSLIGENGAGKSTLMKIIAGYQSPDSGAMLVDGKEVRFRSAFDASAHRIGMVYQEFMLFEDLTVWENICLGDEQLKLGAVIDRAAVREKIQALCGEYDLSFPLDALISDLPVNLKQQVEICKALYRDAELIIFDEPTAILTPQNIRGLFRAFRSLVARGKTIIFITHKLDEVLEVSDHVTVMRGGRVAGEFDTAIQKPTKAQLANTMVGRNVFLEITKQHEIGEASRLKAVGLDLVQGDRHAVKNVSFDVRRGEILGIAGVAGNGQAEIAECLAGLVAGYSGEIELAGGVGVRPGTSIVQRRRAGIGYVPGDRIKVGLSVTSSVWENAVLGYHLTQRFAKWLLPFRKAFAFTDNVVARFNVKTSSRYTRVGTLSGGNMQKLLVGRELSQDYDVLIIEDPTRGVDIGSMEFIWNRMADFVQQGKAIILISHDINEIMALSDRVMVMFGGRSMGIHPIGELTEETLGLLMGGHAVDGTGTAHAV